MQDFTMSGTSSMFSPMTAVGGVMIVIGLVIMALGIVLAVYLKKKGK